MNILEEIVKVKRIENQDNMREISQNDLLKAALELERETYSFRDAIMNSQSGIIAEFKRKSPSKGYIKQDANLDEIISGYQNSGACAVSVLTDSSFFAGSKHDLMAARQILKIPILRKDFVIHKAQICEARIWGADAILLIASILSPLETEELAKFAKSLNMDVLLEIHNKQELAHINSYIDVVGVNNRNLSNFKTDVQTSFELAKFIPSECAKISESGISSPETVRELRKAGFKGFLMGENFMKQDDPALGLSLFIAEL